MRPTEVVGTEQGSAVALGEDLTPCQQAYLASGLTKQQMGLEEFGALYGDAFCALEEE